MITAKSVNKANEEIDRLTDEQLDQAIDRLFGDQPEVLSFLEGYGLGDGEIQELATLLTYFVFKASEAENPGKAATVKREDFESVFDEATAWMAELERPEAIDHPPPESEPLLSCCGCRINRQARIGVSEAFPHGSSFGQENLFQSCATSETPSGAPSN